jgi:mercuric reductase
MSRQLDSNDRTGSELAVIGAGSAGFSAAITAAEQGAQVALIGYGTIGGTCVNVGCVPSKRLIRATETLHQARSAGRFSGISADGRIESWRAVIEQKDQLVGSLRKAKYTDLLPEYNNVSYHEGRARFENGGLTLNGASIDAEKIIIATGSRQFVPDIAGLRDVPYLTSTTAFELEALPKSITVLGGGYIGCEIAQMFARAGVAVTIVFRSALVPEAEPEVSEALAGSFADEGITVVKVGGYDRADKIEGGVSLAVSVDGKTQKIDGEHLLLAAGRIANTENLGLADAGIAQNANGGVKVDDRMRTSRAGVYAAGDVTGRDEFVYMAAYGAKIAANNAINGDSLKYDNSAMPAVVFTDPQVASVGLTERVARDRGIDVKTSVLTLDNVPRALAAQDTRGLIKLVADGATDRLIGAHIIAPEGADSIQTAALAIRHRMTFRELGDMIFPYLTTVEGLKLAAQTFDKDVSKLSCCAG